MAFRWKIANPAGTNFDWTGAGLSAIVLICFLLSITNGHKLGWYSPAIMAGFGIAAAALALFIWWEGKASAPMLDLSFFRSKVFTLGVSARFLSFLGGSAVYFLMPFYLVQGLDFEPSKAGLLMVPGSACIAFWGPFSGRLSDRIGTRWLTVAGMALCSIGMLMFARLDVDSSAWEIVVSIIVEGTGIGLFSSPNTSGDNDGDRQPQVQRGVGVSEPGANLGRTERHCDIHGYSGVHDGVAGV